MATILTTPEQLADEVEEIGRALLRHSQGLRRDQRLFRAMQAQGVAPTTIKTRMDNLLEGYDAQLRRYGAELGNESTAPLLPVKFATEWKAGTPPGVQWLRTGYRNDTSKATADDTTQPLAMILYNDVGPNYDLFSGVKTNDVIDVAGCSVAANNGRYTIKYDVAPKGTVGTASTVASHGPNAAADTFWEGNFRLNPGSWTLGTDYAISGNTLTYTYAAATPSSTTHALVGMTAGAAYTIQFDASFTIGATATGTLKASIGGDYYFEKAVTSSLGFATYSFTTNAPSATPTLTFTCSRATAAVTIAIKNVYVYGAPVLFVVEPFDSDAGANEDGTTTITLRQTAA